MEAGHQPGPLVLGRGPSSDQVLDHPLRPVDQVAVLLFKVQMVAEEIACGGLVGVLVVVVSVDFFSG